MVAECLPLREGPNDLLEVQTLILIHIQNCRLKTIEYKTAEKFHKKRYLENLKDNVLGCEILKHRDMT